MYILISYPFLIQYIFIGLQVRVKDALLFNQWSLGVLYCLNQTGPIHHNSIKNRNLRVFLVYECQQFDNFKCASFNIFINFQNKGQNRSLKGMVFLLLCGFLFFPLNVILFRFMISTRKTKLSIHHTKALYHMLFILPRFNWSVKIIRIADTFWKYQLFYFFVQIVGKCALIYKMNLLYIAGMFSFL